MADVKFEGLPFDERRHHAHPYVDINGWCRDCGRAEGWKAHDVTQTPAAAPDKVTAPLPILSESLDTSTPSPSRRGPRS